MESMQCNLCKSTKNENYLEKDNWQIGRCKNCGLIFLNNIPSDNILESLYDDNFFKDGQKSPKEGIKLEYNPTYLNAQKRLEDIRKYGWEKGMLLDIGCGTGIFIKAASKYYNCIGLDISKDAIEFAVQSLGVEAISGSILDIDFKDQLFDIITMWDVIEHVSDPNEYMRAISRMIHPGGLLAITTGDIESIMFKIQNKNWHLLIPPIHLFYFSPKTITFLLEKHGFKVIKISRIGQYTNIGYMLNKIKRLHSNSTFIKFIVNMTNRFKLNKFNLYMNLYDVMTVYAKYDPRKR